MEMPLSLVLLQSPVLADGVLAIAADVAMIVVTVAVVVTAVTAVVLMRKMSRTIDGVRTGINQNLGPVSDRARSISDNVDFISQALRTDVERLNGSVRALSDRLHQASDRMEERIEEFNALMGVVQEEAEGIFIDTAATVRGVREGAAAITRGAAKPTVDTSPAGGEEAADLLDEASESDVVVLESRGAEEAEALPAREG